MVDTPNRGLSTHFPFRRSSCGTDVPMALAGVALCLMALCAVPASAGETTFAPVLPADIALSADGYAVHFHDLLFDGTRYVEVWRSSEPAQVGIKGQFIGTDGQKGEAFLIPDTDAAQCPKIARAGTGYLVVYSTNAGISGCTVSDAGDVGASFPICDTGGGRQGLFEVMAGGTNILVVWHDYRNTATSGTDLYGRIVTPSGAFASDEFRIGPSVGYQGYPLGCYNGQDFVVFYTQEPVLNSNEKDIYAARVSTAGAVLDPDGFAVCTAAGSQTSYGATCAADPGGLVAVAWLDKRTGQPVLYCVRVTRDGVILDGPPPSSGLVVFQDDYYPAGYPTITHNGRDFVLFFSYKQQFVGAFLGADGTVRVPQKVPVIVRRNPTYSACASDGTNYLVAWSDFYSGQIFAQLVTDANQVPVAEAGTGYSFEAIRGSGTMNGAASLDPDGDLPLKYQWDIVKKPEGTWPSLTGGTTQQATLTSSTPGEYTIALTVTDAHGAVGPSDTITFTVTPFTNRAPVLDPIPAQTVNVGQTVTLQLTGRDPDGDAVTFGANSPPTGLVVNGATGLVSWSPSATQSGVWTVRCWIRDVSWTYGYQDARITVLNPNRPPVLDPVGGDKTVEEGRSLVIDLSATDPDNNLLTFSLTGRPVGATFDTATGLFSWTPTYEQAGDHPVTFGVWDGTVWDSETITIHVLDRDGTPPAITPPSSPVPDANGNVVVGVGDAALATYRIGDGEVHDLAPASGSITIPKSAFGATGTYTVVVTATDAAGNTANSAPFMVTVDLTPPVITPPAARVTLAAGESATVSVGDAADVSYWIEGGVAQEATITDHAITVPAPADEGTYTVVLTALDGAGNEGTASFEIVVPHVNRAPVLGAIGDRFVDENQPLSFTLSAADPENDPLVFGAVSLPAGATLDPDTGTFAWTPGFEQAGTYRVTVSVTDGALSHEGTVVVTVRNVNRPPAIGTAGPQSATEGEVVGFTVAGSDPDHDPLTYSGEGMPAGASLGASSGAFSWPSAVAGTYSVTFSVTDGTASDEETVAITVRDGVPPTLTIPPGTVIGAVPSGGFVLGAADASGSVTISYTVLLDGATVRSATGPGPAVTVPPEVFAAEGTYDVRVTAADAFGTEATGDFTVVVDRTPPAIALPADTETVPEGGFVLRATDPNGPVTVAYIVTEGGREVASGSDTGEVTALAAAFAATGAYTVTVTATDEAGNEATSTFAVRVDRTAPAVGAPVASQNPTPVGAPITVTVGVDDAAAFASGVVSATYSLDGGPWLPMSAADGSFGGAAETVASPLPAFASAGVHAIRFAAIDAAGNRAEGTEELLLAVYDPSAGFVTGGGWIASPPGAYAADPVMTGKATFGFVSKYQKGASVPTGETEFQFRAADFTFRSTAYEWLVVAGAKAQYKGVGTVDGQGDFGFMLTAVDGAVKGGGAPDRFRMKVWDRATGNAIYDNEVGAPDTVDPSTALGGGSIILHASK